jgi:hypothetical protein
MGLGAQKLGLRKIVLLGQDEKSTPKNHPSQKSKLHENEKDLNEIILSRKRENHTETLGGGMWRIWRFGD